MKETYKIIIDKLERDLKRFEAEIFDIIDKVEYSELYQMRYERLIGAKNYTKDLLEFFSEVRDNI